MVFAYSSLVYSVSILGSFFALNLSRNMLRNYVKTHLVLSLEIHRDVQFATFLPFEDT